MFTEIDIDRWKRKATFEFFKDFEDPYFNLTANVDVTELYDYCSSNGYLFSLANLFYSQAALNGIREFRLRMLDEKVVEFDHVEATQTILNDDETFSFCYFQRQESIRDFDAAGRIAREKYLKLKTFDVETGRIDLVYYSAIPWVSFTSFKHAGRADNRQTIPRIVFGKIFDTAGRKQMPVSVEVHHALVDGIHVGKYFQTFQELISAL